MINCSQLAVFVPADTNVPLASLVERGSAIVGCVDDSDAHHITVYYEGNVHGSVNVVTYADRARLAAGRLLASYPTRACAAVDRGTLRQVGWFDQEKGIALLDRGQAQEALTTWLDRESFDPQELHFSGR